MNEANADRGHHMEEKSTLLKIVSRQRDADGMTAEQTDTYRAMIGTRGETICLRYEIEGDKAAMRIQDGAVEILREGALRMKLFIRPGRTLPGMYVTPYGEMDIAVHGHRVMIAQEGARCEVCMAYDVLMGGKLAFSNDVRAVFRR